MKRCFQVWDYSYAAQSVPVFQLAYALATFPNALNKISNVAIITVVVPVT